MADTLHPDKLQSDPVLRDGTHLSDLIDMDMREVKMRVLSDPDLYEIEMKKIFARCWLLVGHESEIPNKGDFIQRALNLKPWLRPTDDPLLEQARIAMTRTAFTTLALLGLLMGAMWPTLMDEPSADPEILLKTARFMMAGMSFIGLTGTALPAAIMAWSIPPLEDSETHDG